MGNREPKFLIVNSNPEIRTALGALLKDLGQNSIQTIDPAFTAENLRSGNYDVRNLTEHVQNAIERISSYRRDSEISMPHVQEPVASFVDETAISDSRIIIRTGSFTKFKPSEDIALATNRGDGKYALLLGDFTGPEERRELELMCLKSRIRLSLKESAAPDFMLNEMNSELVLANGAVDFMTAVVMFIDPVRNVLKYSVAGHNPPLYRRWGSRVWQTLRGDGIPLGVRNDRIYPVYEQRVKPGDRILLITDGIYKIKGAGGNSGDYENLVERLNLLPLDAAPHEVIEEIGDIVESSTSGKIASDEITAMLIQV
jgi:serine phosphatase RsbU (regulator of sigma subunit)